MNCPSCERRVSDYERVEIFNILKLLYIHLLRIKNIKTGGKKAKNRGKKQGPAAAYSGSKTRQSRDPGGKNTQAAGATDPRPWVKGKRQKDKRQKADEEPTR